MSAIADTDGPNPTVHVLFTLHPGFDILDVTGTLRVLKAARHDLKDASSVAFECSFVAAKEHTVSSQGASLRANMDYDDAHEELKEYDMLVVPGGNEQAVIDRSAEPLKLIKAFADMQVADPSKERTLLALSGGSMLLGQEGVLQGMGATTHPDLYTKFEILCQQASRRGELAATELFEERYVVNNARFALGEDDDENPFVFRQRPDGRRKSNAGRRGSTVLKESNRRRESALQRSQLRLGGLRVITAGGGTATFDAALYLVGAMVSQESAEEVARGLQYQWQKGVVVDSIDI